MSRFHAKSLRLGIRQEWDTTQYLFHPRKNSTVSQDESAKSALKHFFHSQNILMAFGPGAIKHHPAKVSLKLYYYAPQPRNKREYASPIPHIASLFPRARNSLNDYTDNNDFTFTAFPRKRNEVVTNSFRYRKRTIVTNTTTTTTSLTENPKNTDTTLTENSNNNATSSTEVVDQSSLTLPSSAALIRPSVSMVQILADVYKKQVDLSLIRLHYPFLSSYILAQYIAINSSRYGVSRVIRALFRKVPVTVISSTNPLFRRGSINETESQPVGTGARGPPSPLEWTKLIRAGNAFLPAHIAGIRVQVSGRMGSKKGAERTAVMSRSLGSFRFHSMTKSMIDYSKVEGKNKNGSFTVKVWISSTCGAPRGVLSD